MSSEEIVIAAVGTRDLITSGKKVDADVRPEVIEDGFEFGMQGRIGRVEITHEERIQIDGIVSRAVEFVNAGAPRVIDPVIQLLAAFGLYGAIFQRLGNQDHVDG